MNSNFYKNEVKPLAERIVRDNNVEKELCFQADNNIYILSQIDGQWTFMRPYWSSEVIEYFEENPPEDFTEYLEKM